jgi:hypothetical protein
VFDAAEVVPVALIQKVMEQFHRDNSQIHLLHRHWPVMLDPDMSPRSHVFVYRLILYIETVGPFERTSWPNVLSQLVSRSQPWERCDLRWPSTPHSAAQILSYWERRLLQLECFQSAEVGHFRVLS